MRNLLYLFFALQTILQGVKGQAVVKCETDKIWRAGEFSRVEIIINFDSNDGFARLTQHFPEGVEDIIPENLPPGDFSWYNKQLTVVWMTLPAERRISLSYLVRTGKSMDGTFDINGKLVWIKEGKINRTFTMEIVPVTVVTGQGTDETHKTQIKAKPKPSGTASGVKVSEQEKSEPLAPGDQIIFRIQIAASSNPVPPSQIAEKKGLERNVTVVRIKSGNIYKYQAGSFTTYEEASAFHKKLVSAGLKDAFLVAYRGETQVPVSEAFKERK